MLAAVAVLLVVAVALAGSSLQLMLTIVVALTILVGYTAVRWPRAAVILVVLSPVIDRYLVAGLMPAEFERITHFASEAVLIVVASVIVVSSLRRGTLLPALRHPSTAALTAFVCVAVVSTVVNDVPAAVALAGLGFTIDAAILFYLPRMIGFSVRQAAMAIVALLGVVVLAAVIATLQALLSPDLFGLAFVQGRFGEVHRLAAFFRDPNVFGAFVIATVPFALLGTRHLASERLRRIAVVIAFLLLLVLWLSFSRGAWLALVIGVGSILAVVDRRALLLGLLLAALSFATAVVMPRDLAVPTSSGGGGEAPHAERPDLIGSTIDRVETIGAGRDLRTLFVLNAVPIFADHAVVGVGPGRYGGGIADAYPTPVYETYGTDALFRNPAQRTVDNFWLHIIVEMGTLGFVALLAAALVPGLAILHAGTRALGLRRILLLGVATATAGLAANSVTTMLLEANSIGFTFWFLLGLGTLLVQRHGEAAETRAP